MLDTVVWTAIHPLGTALNCRNYYIAQKEEKNNCSEIEVCVAAFDLCCPALY